VTLLRPRKGAFEEMQRLLDELDESLAATEGLILSFVTQVETDRLGRVSLWHSKEDANRVAGQEHILSVRSRLHRLSLDTQELLMEVKSGHVPATMTALLAGDLDIEATRPPAGAEVA
jgi:hypothetical protein